MNNSFTGYKTYKDLKTGDNRMHRGYPGRGIFVDPNHPLMMCELIAVLPPHGHVFYRLVDVITGEEHEGSTTHDAFHTIFKPAKLVEREN